MSALRQSLTRRNFLLIAAAALVAAAIFDWSRPPGRQFSVWLYDHAVIAPYQQHIRPHTHGFIRCRFRPSCSEYSFQAMRTHGFAKGAALSLWRICRCEPWVKMGTYDPVPPAAPSPSERM